MKRNPFLRWIICLVLCAVMGGAPAALSQEQSPQTPQTPPLAGAVDGARLLKEVDPSHAWNFGNTLEKLRHGQYVENGNEVILFGLGGNNKLKLATMSLDTLEASEYQELDVFGEEIPLQVLPRRTYCHVLTSHALYRFDHTMKLTLRSPLPTLLMDMPEYQNLLSNCDVNPPGTFLLFESAGKESGVYVCALQPEAKPHRLLPGITFADESSGTLEGFREPSFIGADRLMVYIAGQNGRLGWSVYDLDGQRLFHSFVFNQLAYGEDYASPGDDEHIGRIEARNDHGLLMMGASSLRGWVEGNFYFDFASLQMKRMVAIVDGRLALPVFSHGTLLFCALDGESFVYGVDASADDTRHNRVIFFRQNLLTCEQEQLSFEIRGAVNVDAALAPDGRILFRARDVATDTDYVGVFR